MYRNYINHYKITTFTKTFGLYLTQFKEGYFTHLFNTRANMDTNYNNELPPMKYYMTARMAKKMKHQFGKWNAEEKAKGVKFNLTEELEVYCIDDVKLLLEGCLTFQRDVHKQARLNPFQQLTISSACNQDLGIKSHQSRHAGSRTSLRLAFEC